MNSQEIKAKQDKLEVAKNWLLCEHRHNRVFIQLLDNINTYIDSAEKDVRIVYYKESFISIIIAETLAFGFENKSTLPINSVDIVFDSKLQANTIRDVHNLEPDTHLHYVDGWRPYVQIDENISNDTTLNRWLFGEHTGTADMFDIDNGFLPEQTITFIKERFLDLMYSLKDFTTTTEWVKTLGVDRDIYETRLGKEFVISSAEHDKVVKNYRAWLKEQVNK